MPPDSSDPPCPPDRQPSRGPRLRFREAAIASGLLTAVQLDELDAELRAGPGPALEHADGAIWDKSRADRAVARAWISRFQAQELLAGKTRFRLGSYLIVDELGRGGMGQVFKAEHELMGRTVAVKVLPRTKSTPESEAQFRREMRILGRLDHENLVRAFDAGHDAMVSYLVTEYVPGFDLRRQVRKYGPLEEEVAASVFRQVARGLAYAHGQCVIHRDVKPGNILVMDDGRAKILDMGLAGSTIEAEAVRLGRIVGTVDYMAPDQIAAPDEAGPSADIYALGCTLYFALSGEVPFPGGTRNEKIQRQLHAEPRPLQSLAPHLSRAMCGLVEALMEKSPTDRPASAEDVAARLSRWGRGGVVPPPRPASVSDGRPQRRTARGGEQSTSTSVSQSFDPLDAAEAWTTAAPGLRGRIAAGWSRLVRETSLAAWLAVVRGIAISVAAGMGFGWVIGYVRYIDPGRFESLPIVGSLSSLMFGIIGFAFVLAVQAAAAFMDRRQGHEKAVY
jgi:serine/threonine protein kinase